MLHSWTADLAAAIGLRVRQERQGRHWTLDQLSGLVGVSRRMLVNVEQGAANPSVGTLLWTSDVGGRGVLVAGTEPPDVGERWDWVLAPGNQHVSEAHTVGTRELLQVHGGAIVLEGADQSLALGAGDAAAFTGEVAHSYASHGSTPARFSLAVCEPGAGTRSLHG